MSKITIAGNATVVTSTLKLEELATIKKYRPKALILMGGENNKEEIFRIDVGTSGCGEMNQYGAYFCNVTPDDKGLACITMCNNGVAGDKIKEHVAEALGVAVIYLNKLEEALPAVLEEIKTEKAAVMGAITVI